MKKVMVITGGSRGIGAVTALLAANTGYAVCIGYFNGREPAEANAADIRQDGGEVMTAQVDVCSEADVERLFREVDETLGPVTSLVNNAGIIALQSRVDAMDAARLQRVFSTNVIGSFLCAREAVRRMSTAHGGAGGAIVNVSSAAARLGSPNEFVDYAAAKGAIDTFTVGLAKEVASEGIRVNAVRPGLIYTDIHASSGDPERVDRLKAGVPMQRGGYPEEVAEAILWLLSEKASYTSGTLLDVAGGR